METAADDKASRSGVGDVPRQGGSDKPTDSEGHPKDTNSTQTMERTTIPESKGMNKVVEGIDTAYDGERNYEAANDGKRIDVAKESGNETPKGIDVDRSTNEADGIGMTDDVKDTDTNKAIANTNEIGGIVNTNEAEDVDLTKEVADISNNKETEGIVNTNDIEAVPNTEEAEGTANTNDSEETRNIGAEVNSMRKEKGSESANGVDRIFQARDREGKNAVQEDVAGDTEASKSYENNDQLKTNSTRDVEENGKVFDTERNDKNQAQPGDTTRNVATNGETPDTDVKVTDGGHMEKQPKKRFHGRQLRYRVFKTGCLVTTWICIGLFTELSGPTFKDLEQRLNLPSKQATEAVSRATSGRSLGFLFGAVIGGFLVDRFKRKGDLFIGLSLCGGAAVTVGVPWMSTMVTMWFLMFCQGTFEGIINIAGQEIILLLWGEKSAGPMHLLHFGFGMGSFINPLIAQPFLGIRQITNSSAWYLPSSEANNTGGHNVTTTETLVGSRIQYAYLIAALITATFSLTFFLFQHKGVPHGGYVEDHIHKTEDVTPTPSGCKGYVKLVDPATCADGKRLAGFAIFALLFLFFFQAVGGERVYSKFIRNFALDQKQLDFSSSEATYLNSSFWISFSIGRFLGFIVAIWVPIRILIIVECFSGLGFAILLNFLGHNNKLALWVLTQPMSLFVAPLFPSGVAWSDHYLKMSGIGITILIGGGSLGGVVYIWVLGYLYPNYGPQTFLYVVAVYSVLACVSVCLLSLAGHLHGDRFKKEQMEMEVAQGGPDKDNPKAITYVTSVELQDL